MASEFPQQSENGDITEDIKTRKSLRSAVITENDTLKIKLKISKRDIMEPSKSKREGSVESKNNRNLRNNVTSKGEDKNQNENSNIEERGNDDEPKMKLRSKKENDQNDDEIEHRKEENEEGCNEKKKKGLKSSEENLNESSEIIEKPVKKRGRPSKIQIEESEKLEEKRRIKRLETESSEEGRNFEDSKIPKESFCWTCHKDGSVVKCDTCPRVFHLKCVSLSKDPSKDWICPECSLVLHAEKISTRSEAMKNLSLDQLCTLLNFAIGRMKNVPESQAFWKPVDPKEVPFYDKYITNPMDLNLLEKNMKAKMYGSPQAFLADAKWLLHNSIIFNSTQSPLTSTARFLVKICKQEMAEIENCPDCYLNAHTKKEWFIEVCRKPHILIWARLKGFPFWPAKAMSTNLKTQSVDARFFGAHDKAWVPVKECYLYSKNSPQLISKKRADLDDAFLEADGYIKKIKQKYGMFCYAPDKTPFNPELYDKQLQSMIPTYQEQKLPKKKRKKHVPEENGVMEKNVQTGKKLTEHGTQHRFKLKNSNLEDLSKASEDICFMNDYISDERILSEDKISPEDEVERSLEMYDTAAKIDGDTVEENSTDLEEDGSIPIPEHGYSRSFDVGNEIDTQENDDDNVVIMGEVLSEVKKVEDDRSESNIKEKKSGDDVEDQLNKVQNMNTNSVLRVQESSKLVEETKNTTMKGVENQQRSLSSSAEMTNSCAHNEEGNQNNINVHVSSIGGKRKSIEQIEEGPPKKLHIFDDVGKKINDECLKKEDDRSTKSFTNLSMNQKQKILTEAKLLANIDEMTASGKQKVLNELGLDASLVDIRELAQENRQILETLNKKRHNESKDLEEVPIKNEDFEQYLMEESHEENELIQQESEGAIIPKPGSIKVRDFQTLSSKIKSSQSNAKSSGETKLKVMDLESFKDVKGNKKELKLQKKKSSDDSNSKKLKLEPVIELIKLDVYDKSLQKLNRKLRLSDEVSLLMIDGEKKMNVDCTDVSVKKLPGKKTDRPPRARKRMPNRTRQRDNQSGDSSSMRMPSKNINVISVDTENSNAQKNLLKSLCSEDRKIDDDNLNRGNKKTVLITTNDKGIKNFDVTTSDEVTKKSVNEVTIESVSNNGKGSESVKDGISLCQQKNLTVVANSHLIVTNNGPTFLTNQNNQPNLALAQNNLGQLSLVHLTNLTSGIQTNFVNLANETIGLNNSIGTIYATPSFNADGSCPSVSSNGNGSVILTSSPTTGLTCSTSGSTGTANKCMKGVPDQNKLSATKINANRSNSGISVKSPASLGLVTNQSSKLPPVVAKAGDESFVVGEVGSVTAELNRHSIKMAEYMRATIEDILRELSNQGSLEAKCKSLTIEMEKLQWRHQQEIMELKHHSERSLMELRTSLESEKQKCLAELKSQLEARHQKIISETKNKQWCANCGKEALFYCCWNTSYCDYPCQQQHWPDHMSRCAQLGNNVQASNQLQNKNLKYQNAGYVPIMSRAGGSHGSGPFTIPNRSIPNVQAQSQGRRSSDPPTPQLPINITIRPQHYFM